MFIETKKIPIDRIQLSIHHLRQHSIRKDVEKLAESIRKVGLIQPVVVYEIDDGMYELIVGQRRFIACIEFLKWTEIMAMIIEKPEDEEETILMINHNEGIPRAPIGYDDKMHMLRRLFEKYNS